MIHVEFYLEGSDRNDLFDYACADHIPTIGSKVCLTKQDYHKFSVVDIEFWFDDQCHRPDQVQTVVVVVRPVSDRERISVPKEPLPELVAAWYRCKNAGGSDYDAYRAMVTLAKDTK